jgi:hypothetical protein
MTTALATRAAAGMCSGLISLSAASVVPVTLIRRVERRRRLRGAPEVRA